MPAAHARSFVCAASLLFAAALVARADSVDDALARARVTLDVSGAPLAGIVESLAGQAGVAIALDPGCAEALAAGGGDKFIARVKDAPAGVVLDALLDSAGLFRRSQGGRIEIVPAAKVEGEFVTRAYPLGDLLGDFGADAPGDEAGEARSAGRDFLHIVASLAGDVDWTKAPSMLSVDRDTLWVTQTRGVQSRVNALLEDLRGTAARTVELRAALVEMPLERWRALAPAGARDLRGDEFDELVREARNKSRVLREFSAAADEGREARFETATFHPYLGGYQRETDGEEVKYSAVTERDTERIACSLRPAVQAGDERILVGVRCELRRPGPSGMGNTSVGPVELPRAAERRIGGTLAIKPGGAFAWRLGGLFTGEERDRVLALLVRVVAVRDAAVGADAQLFAPDDPRLARARLADAVSAPSLVEAAAEAARRAGLGVACAVRAKPGEAAASFAAGLSAGEVVRAAGDRLGLEASTRAGVLTLRPATADGALRVARLPSAIAAQEDLPAFTPLASAVRFPSRTTANPFRAAPDRTGAAPSLRGIGGAGPVLVAGGRLFWRVKGDADPVAPMVAESGRGSVDAAVVEADLVEIDPQKLAERAQAIGASGLALDPAAARELLDAADRMNGVDRRVGLTWTSASGQAGGGAQLSDEACLPDNPDPTRFGSVHLSTGLAVRVRVRRDGDGHQVEVDGEWAETAAPAVGPDGGASGALPAVAVSLARGEGRVADGGALAFALTPGASSETKTLLLVVRVTRPAAAAEKK